MIGFLPWFRFRRRHGRPDPRAQRGRELPTAARRCMHTAETGTEALRASIPWRDIPAPTQGETDPGNLIADEYALLPSVSLPWQQQPRPVPRWTRPTRSRPLQRLIRHCWGCGRFGVTFCATGCLPATCTSPVPPWRAYTPPPPTPAEEAEDARIAAVLDAERAA